MRHPEIAEIVRRDRRYAYEAYEFIFDALGHTQQLVGRKPREGEPVGRLMYLADGIVKIERGDRIVAICGPGDYIGELSFLSGAAASATATVVKPARILAFDQRRLTTAIEADAQLHRTLESALNRNLAGKLVRSNDVSLAERSAG